MNGVKRQKDGDNVLSSLLFHPRKIETISIGRSLASVSSYYSPSHIKEMIQWFASSSTLTVAGAASDLTEFPFKTYKCHHYSRYYILCYFIVNYNSIYYILNYNT